MPIKKGGKMKRKIATIDDLNYNTLDIKDDKLYCGKSILVRDLKLLGRERIKSYEKLLKLDLTDKVKYGIWVIIDELKALFCLKEEDK